VQEDSGNPSQLYLLGHTGQVIRKVFLLGIKNRDWEDLALVNNDLFIGDIGDNRGVREHYSFYRLPEPAPGIDTVKNIQRIQFKYPDGSHDAEAFLIDPQTQAIFIITKRDSLSLIYQLSAPYSLTGVNQVKRVGKLPYNGVVSATLSPDGRKIIVKTYTNLLSYTRTPGESLAATLNKKYKNLPYEVEPQGEAVTFARNNTGYFTLSERRFDLKVNLYFYPYLN
jgi:hypothetical protein